MNDEINSDAFKDICGMIEQMQELIKEGIKIIEPQINAVIRNKITDNHRIETLLDQLLDYAGMDETGLVLFKRLCRYYYFINPQATADYVYIYRDLYDSDEIDETNEEI